MSSFEKLMQGKKMPVLPTTAYTSQEWYDLEQRHIFGNTWQFAGLIEDVKHAGDYVTVQCGLSNIMILRGRDQRLRAFHNICRHRGTQLLRAVGKKQKAITCPYHDWTYDLRGQLISVPEEERQFPGLDKGKFCLHKASVETWRGMIFVHPRPDAEPLMEYLDGVHEWLGPHQPENLVEYEGTRLEEIINANWKIVAENYIDGYHLAHLHSNTLNMYDHAKQESRFVGPHYVFWEPLAATYRDNLKQMIPYKRITGMTDDILGAFVPLLYPNIGLSETESSWSIFHIIPLGPAKTKVIVRSKIEPMSSAEYAAYSVRSGAGWAKFGGNFAKYEGTSDDPMASGDFMKEDIYACEQQQRSLKSPLFSVGATALELEKSVRDFQEIVLAHIKKGEEN